MEIRELLRDDYNLGYLDLVRQLSNYDSKISYSDFCKYLELNPNYKIFVIVDMSYNKLIACGSFFILNKVHTNPIGQIEDVVVDESYRGLGYGKVMIDYLVKYGREKTSCYKIVLNCNPNNLEFYYKCGFKDVGVQCKYIK